MTRKTPAVGMFGPGRVLVWFSCGAASAVAAKLAVETYPDFDVEVLYCDTLKYEHPDNPRFMADVSAWIGRPIKLLRSNRFADIYDVFRREQFLKGPGGAPCTKHLKRAVRKAYQQQGDVQVLGYTVEERDRIDGFELDNPDVTGSWVLADQGVTKSDCYRIIREAGIALPTMYLLGYRNNNCIGCVKGGAGYWNKIRRDYAKVLLPFDAFADMAAMEREVGFALLRVKGKPCHLDELPTDAGRYDEEPDIECGPQCVVGKAEVA
jgi:hypothetical protein